MCVTGQQSPHEIKKEAWKEKEHLKQNKSVIKEPGETCFAPDNLLSHGSVAPASQKSEDLSFPLLLLLERRTK